MLASLRFFRALATAGSLSALVVASNAAHAQGRDPAAATELFTQGREMLKNGDVDKACPLFAESLRLDPAVGTALNLAECEERRGQLTGALRAWQQAINLAEATNDERGEVARERFDALSPKVPRLTIVLTPDAPEGTKVLRENVELGEATFGRPLPVDPGKHVITITAPGRQDEHKTIVLGEGDDKTLTVSPGAPLEPDGPPPKPPIVDAGVNDGSSQRTMAYVLGGVGAAGVLAAAVSGVMLMNSRKSVDDHCDDQNRCDREGLDAADKGKTLVPINTIAWAVGVAGLGAGAYFYFTAPPPDAASPNATGWRPSGAYVQVQGQF